MVLKTNPPPEPKIFRRSRTSRRTSSDVPNGSSPLRTHDLVFFLFVSSRISFARFSRASSVRGGSPASSIDSKTAYASAFEPAFAQSKFIIHPDVDNYLILGRKTKEQAIALVKLRAKPVPVVGS